MLVDTPIHAANVIYIAIFSGIRGRLNRLREAEARALALPAERRLYPVPLVEADEARVGPPGWQASLALSDEARLIRIEVEDVDYLGTRRLEARADSGW